MMGRKSGQLQMLVVALGELIPENHLLKKIDACVSFSFLYDLLAPYYPKNGRPFIDPVSMFKMLLVGYLYEIKSERRLVQEVQINIAYCWFCGFELSDVIPVHSTFSKARIRKWNESALFEKSFFEIVRQCIEGGLIDGKEVVAGGSYLPAQVSKSSWIEVEQAVDISMQSYLDALDQELSAEHGFKKPPVHTELKKRTTSSTDPDFGGINHGNKRGIGYMVETTVDCKNGIITGVDTYPENQKESLIILRHLKKQQRMMGLQMQEIALDRGYGTGAVYRGLELLGIIGYIPAIDIPNSPSKYGFQYDPDTDSFICPMGQTPTYHRLNCNKSTGKYLRCYQIPDDSCVCCSRKERCFDKTGLRRRILGSSCYPAFHRGHMRVGTSS